MVSEHSGQVAVKHHQHTVLPFWLGKENEKRSGSTSLIQSKRNAWHEKVAVVESTRQDPGPGRVRISGAMHGPKPKETSSAGLFAVSQSDLDFQSPQLLSSYRVLSFREREYELVESGCKLRAEPAAERKTD